MRTTLQLAAALAALTLVPSALAQDECSQANPCLWLVDVDETGLYGDGTEPVWNFTVGDWFVLNVSNLDEVGHTLMLAGHPVTVQVGALDEAQSAPFRFTQAGTFQLTDDLGRTGTVHVFAGDVNDQEIITGSTSSSSGASTSAGIPALPWAVLGLALVCAAALRRR